MSPVRRNRKRTIKRKRFTRRTPSKRKAVRPASRPQRAQLWGSKTGATSYVARRSRPTRLGRYVRNQIMNTGSGSNFYCSNGAFRITGTAGQQAYGTVAGLGAPSDTDSIFTAINSSATRMFISTARQESWFTNQGAANLFVRIYECWARKDVPAAESSFTALYGQGFTDMQLGTAGNKLGISPFQNNKFCSFFKILKVHDRMLHAGESFNLVLTCKRNKFMNRESMKGTSQIAFGKYTKFFLVTAFSAPLNDQTTKSTVSTGTIALDVVSVNKYTYKWINDYDNNIFINNTLPTTLTEYIMDYATGSAAADTVA